MEKCGYLQAVHPIKVIVLCNCESKTEWACGGSYKWLCDYRGSEQSLNSLQLPTKTYKEIEDDFCFGMQLDKIFARRLQSSSWTDISSVYLCWYTNSWSDFHSTCLHSVSCNYTIQTNGLISELYMANGKLYWKFQSLWIALVCIFLRWIEKEKKVYASYLPYPVV